MGDQGIRSLNEVLGANVRARRTGLNLTQSDLAETLNGLLGGWGPAVVSRLEAGKRQATIGELMALAGTLNATPDELLDPLAVGDDRPVNLFGEWAIDARKLRVLVRGEGRVQTTIKDGKVTQRYGQTDRGGPVGVMTLMARTEER